MKSLLKGIALLLNKSLPFFNGPSFLAKSPLPPLKGGRRHFTWLLALILTLSFFLPLSGQKAWACDEERTRSYVSQILFGDLNSPKARKEEAQMLFTALYLCTQQAGGEGEERLSYLKEKKVDHLPAFREIRLEEGSLLSGTHQGWEASARRKAGGGVTEKGEEKRLQKKWEERRDLLIHTVERIFDFGFFEELFGGGKGKCNAFAAYCYDLHLLSDYLADDQGGTEILVEGRIPLSYQGKPFQSLGGKPVFRREERESRPSSFSYSPLDELGRAGLAFGHIGPKTLSQVGERGEIGGIRPSGWQTIKYEGLIRSAPPFLYNRCHLLAHQLGGIDEKENLITGTRYLNAEGMKPFEDQIRQYVEETGDEVFCRVTPIYHGSDLLARGVLMEASSLREEGLSLRVYLFNLQPGVALDYSSGESRREDLVTGQKAVLPFAAGQAGEECPDLLWEIKRHLEELFEDQRESYKYRDLMGELDRLSVQARALGEEGSASYLPMKELQYHLVEVLKSYVPLLLRGESFFTDVFSP